MLVVVLNVHHLMIIAQPASKFTYWENAATNGDELELVLNSLATYNRVVDASIEDWCSRSCMQKRYVGITHVPSLDFNIYLAYHHSITPKLSTSFEVSLNYAGVMNIKSLFLLRKRNR